MIQGNFEYRKLDGEPGYAVIVRCRKDKAEMVIPAKLDHLKVVTIGDDDRAFYGCVEMQSVVIPASVREIARFSFCPNANNEGLSIGEPSDIENEHCVNLTTITVAADNPVYTSRDGVLFEKAGKTLLCYPAGRNGAYTIPDGVTKIEAFAFASCRGLTALTMPDSVTDIGYGAFCACGGLTAVSLPAGVTAIGDCAFNGCGSLDQETREDLFKRFGLEIRRRGDFAYGTLDKQPGCAVITAYCGRDAEVAIPAELAGLRVVKIGYMADADCDFVTSVIIPDGVTEIGSDAFFDCTGLASVHIPGSVTKISAGAFEGCTGLTSVLIPDSVTVVEGDAFADCENLREECREGIRRRFGDRVFLPWWYCRG